MSSTAVQIIEKGQIRYTDCTLDTLAISLVRLTARQKSTGIFDVLCYNSRSS